MKRNVQKDNDLDITDKLKKQFQIKKCFVKLNFMHTEKSSMDETSPAPSDAAKKRPGRKPKASLKQTGMSVKTIETPKSGEKTNDSIEEIDDNPRTDEISTKNEKSVEKKQTKKEAAEPIVESGGRGKRTRKPNPKYMDESMVSATKHLGRDDSAESENAEGEDGDDEMQSSDEPRNDAPLKKRMLQKHGIKSTSARKTITGKNTPINTTRKSAGSVATKRKLEVDIDIDDERGKQLFLDAKRRFTQSPLNSDDESGIRKGKNTVTDVLAAKLRSKFPGEFTVKRTVIAETKINTANRSRIFERNKLGFQKEEEFLTRKQNSEETETSEDDSIINKNTSDQEASSPKNNNRRKTQHTKILSDDRIVRATPTGQLIRRGPSGTLVRQINKPLTQNQLLQSKMQSNTPTKTYSIAPQSRIIGSNKPAILRPPPRILNSTLCRPTNKSTVPSLVTKLVTKDDYEQDVNGKRNNNVISSRSKENVTSYTYTEKDGKMIPKKTVVQLPQNNQHLKLLQQRKAVLPVVRTQSKQQKIISEPVSMNLPNSRRIRKITCFETWYVIKMAEEHQKIGKSVLNLSLMQIGNEIKKVTLPSEEWTYKILLQPLSKQLLAIRKNKGISETDSESKQPAKDEETFATGDSEIKENEKETSTETEQNKEGKDTTIKHDSKSDDSKEENEKTTEGNDDKESKISGEGKATTVDQEIELKGKGVSDEVSDMGVEKNKAILNEQAENEHDTYTGEVHDPNIKADERHNYRPINIMFRRKCLNPNIRIQFDRTVILKNQTFYLNVDGKNVRLVASPQSIDSYDDIGTLLQIVNDIDLSSCCVELATTVA